MGGLAFVVLMASCLFVFVFLVELFRVSEVENECRRLRYRNALLDNQLTDINGKIELMRADVDHLANTVDYLSTPDAIPVVVEDIPVMPKKLESWNEVEVIGLCGTRFGVVSEDNGKLTLTSKRDGEEWPHGVIPDNEGMVIQEGYTRFVVINDAPDSVKAVTEDTACVVPCRCGGLVVTEYCEKCGKEVF